LGSQNSDNAIWSGLRTSGRTNGRVGSAVQPTTELYSRHFQRLAHAKKECSMQPEYPHLFVESIEEHSWSVMARGLRHYLTQIADYDGALIRDHDDPLEALLRTLNASPNETESVRAELVFLAKRGFLSVGQRSVFMGDRAHAFTHLRMELSAAEPPARRNSTERVRRHRERLRIAKLSGAATTARKSVPLCGNDGVIELPYEISVRVRLTASSANTPTLTNAKCVND
jgi:hypothetical protein